MVTFNDLWDKIQPGQSMRLGDVLDKLRAHKCPVKVTPYNPFIEHYMYLIFSTKLYFKLIYPTIEYTPCDILVPLSTIKYIAGNWSDTKKLVKYFAERAV